MLVYNTGMTLWWALLVLGVVLYSASIGGTIAAYGSERIPRLGFWPDTRAHKKPWWSYLALSAGIFLLTFTTGHLASWDDWTGPLLLLGSALVGLLIQISVVAIHNRRQAADIAYPKREESANSG